MNLGQRKPRENLAEILAGCLHLAAPLVGGEVVVSLVLWKDPLLQFVMVEG